MYLQKTIRKPFSVTGVGIHSGKKAKITIKPAPSSTGVYFVRTDLEDTPHVKTYVTHVKATQMATSLGKDRPYISTVEHFLSAVTALNIDNLIVETDGPEVPIMDGSALEFLKGFETVGLIEQDAPRKYAYIKEHIQFGEGDKHTYVSPFNGLRVTCTIDFPHPAIGLQTYDAIIDPNIFKKEIAPARTFGFLKDVESLKKMGLAKGGSLDNAIILDDQKVMNSGGLRFDDEFVRHKILDALGDLATLGQPIMGHIVLYKSGHDMMNKLVHKILNSPQSYELKEIAHTINSHPNGI